MPTVSGINHNIYSKERQVKLWHEPFEEFHQGYLVGSEGLVEKLEIFGFESNLTVKLQALYLCDLRVRDRLLDLVGAPALPSSINLVYLLIVRDTFLDQDLRVIKALIIQSLLQLLVVRTNVKDVCHLRPGPLLHLDDDREIHFEVLHGLGKPFHTDVNGRLVVE